MTDPYSSPIVFNATVVYKWFQQCLPIANAVTAVVLVLLGFYYNAEDLVATAINVRLPLIKPKQLGDSKEFLHLK